MHCFLTPHGFDDHCIGSKRDEVSLWELLQCCDGDVTAMQENAESSLKQYSFPSVLVSIAVRGSITATCE